MSREILPDTDGLELVDEKEFDSQRGTRNIQTWEGPADEIDSKFDDLTQGTNPFDSSDPVQVRSRTARGRGSVSAVYERVIATFAEPDTTNTQELSAVDVLRPIYLADYFSTLTNANILDVRKYVDDQAAADSGWSTLQKRLYGHLMRGQEEYYETAYVFRETFVSTSEYQLRVASSNPNTVVTLPDLGWKMQSLIDALPSGEWLKRPTVVRYLGRDGFEVSVIYGGSFTGEKKSAKHGGENWIKTQATAVVGCDQFICRRPSRHSADCNRQAYNGRRRIVRTGGNI